MATLTITDNADGTGGVATIAGGTSGTNTVKAWRPNPITRALVLTATETRTGDGTVALAVDPAAYIITLENAGALAVAPVWATLTEGNASEYGSILDGLVAYFQTLALPGVDPATIRKTKVPVDFGDANAGVIVCPAQESLEPIHLRDKIGYGCQVTAYRPANKASVANLSAELATRDLLIHSLEITPSRSPQAIVNVATVFNITVEPGAVVLPGWWVEKNTDVSLFIARVWCYRTRG